VCGSGGCGRQQVQVACGQAVVGSMPGADVAALSSDSQLANTSENVVYHVRVKAQIRQPGMESMGRCI